MLPSISISMKNAFTDAELDRQKDIVLARKYHEGDHGVVLTERLLQFISDDFPFRLNISRSVVTAVSERLKVIGFDSPSEELHRWATDVWEFNKMAARQEDLYENALRDGECALIVGWDEEFQMPTFSVNQRYTSSGAGGNGFGVSVKYLEDDPNLAIVEATKIWNELDESSKVFFRRNEYFPDRILKSIMRPNSMRWEPLEKLPWVDSAGKPLGVAAVNFTNKGLRCEAWDAFPLQDSLNKTLVDMLTASDQTAFRIYYSIGFIPTSDGKSPAPDQSNWLKVQPGTVIATTKSRRDAEFGAIEPARIEQLMDEVHQIVLWVAMVTNTPVSRFISTRLVASDATLKEQEGPLISRITARQAGFGGTWKDCFKLALKLNNTFGTKKLLEDVPLTLMWSEAAARGEEEKLDLLEKKMKIGIPKEQLWIEAGYDQATIEKMKGMSQDGTTEPPNGTDSGGTEGAAEGSTGSASGATELPEDGQQ